MKKLLISLLILCASNSVVAQKLGKGDKAPDFTAKTADGTEFNLHQTLESGKYVLLNFTAVECGYCYIIYPHLIKIQQKYPDNLQVVAVYGGVNGKVDTPEQWDQMAQQIYKEYYQKVADNKIFSVWNAGFLDGVYYNISKVGWPNFFLISPDGEIVDKMYGARDEALNKMIDKNLNKN